MAKRVFLIVARQLRRRSRAGRAPFRRCRHQHTGGLAGHPNFRGDNLARLGMFNLDGVTCGTPAAAPIGSYAAA